MNPFNIWIFLLIPLLLLKVDPTECEVHSLNYIYTAFSKPVNLPGIHEFTAMRQLDGRTIEYYDSVNQKLVPKQTWMEERLPAEYWVDGTRYRQYKQHWFKVNIDILMKRMRQNATDRHILQWMYGCEGDMQPDGTLQFKQGWDIYNYDGKVFLYDYFQRLWVDQTEAAKEREGPILKEYYQGQQERCIEWLSKFITYAEKQLKSAPPPDVFLFAKNANVSAIAVLVCLATGFNSNYTKLQIRKDGRLLEEEDGVITSGVRRNGDGTYQRRDKVEIVRAEVAQYTCEVNHKTSKVFVLKVWDHKLPVDPNSGGVPIGAVVGALVAIVLLTVVVVIGVLYKKRIIGCSCGSNQGGSTEQKRETAGLTAAVPQPDSGSTGSPKGSAKSLNSNADDSDDSDGSDCSDVRCYKMDVERGSMYSDSGVSTTNNSGCPPTPESRASKKNGYV